MTFKTIVVLLLLFIIYNLFAGLFYLLNDKGKTNRAVNSLTWRIGLSIFVFVLLLVGSQLGWITPHGVTPY